VLGNEFRTARPEHNLYKQDMLRRSPSIITISEQDVAEIRDIVERRNALAAQEDQEKAAAATAAAAAHAGAGAGEGDHNQDMLPLKQTILRK
jgi:hypothetical protein